MNYDIRIVNNYEGKGRLELERLAFLSKHVKSIAQKALLLQAFGYSKVSLPRKYKKYLHIFLTNTGVADEDTLLTLDADNFQDLPIQLDLFRGNPQLDSLTPVALVIQTLRAAVEEGGDQNLLDEPLIDDLIKFKKFFHTDQEQLWLSNRGSLPEIRLSEKEIDKIEGLYKEIPAPEPTVINGRVDEMKFSGKQFILHTADKQRVMVLLDSAEAFDKVKDFFGKELTVKGQAYFKLGGQLSYVALETIHEPTEADRVFSKRPQKTSMQQKIAMQLKAGKKSNPLDDIIGKWPGNETDEEFEQMLKDLD